MASYLIIWRVAQGRAWKRDTGPLVFSNIIFRDVTQKSEQSKSSNSTFGSRAVDVESGPGLDVVEDAIDLPKKSVRRLYTN